MKEDEIRLLLGELGETRLVLGKINALYLQYHPRFQGDG